MTVHDFQTELEFSEKAGHEPFWEAVYHKAFPNIVSMMASPGDTVSQRLGIDRVILLASGKLLKIDEKKRRKVYTDFCLEYISVDTTNAAGWIEKDLPIDYLAYAFMPSKKCYLLAWDMLRRAWLHFKNEWFDKYNIIEAQNKGYKTLSLGVPIPIVLNAVKNAMIIQL
jgi:hypothetical protein